jgi:hypothetical protein
LEKKLTTEKIQEIHSEFYNAKLQLLQNDNMQKSFGIDEKLKTNLWRATQIITVHYLKEKWAVDQVGDSYWNLLFGNAKSAIAKISVANGDKTFYVEAALDGVFFAADVFMLADIAANVVWKVGMKYFIIEGGAKKIGQHAYYSVCKKAVALRLSYILRFGTPEATTFFNKQLTKTIEIYDISASRYIKFDPATGEALSGKFVAGEGQSITYESYGKISVKSGLSETEQANVVVAEITKMLPMEWVIKYPSWKAGRILKGNISNPIGAIGSFERDIKQLILDIGYKETTDLAYSQNGIKLLNTPKTVYKPGTFWVEYNEPWLKGITDAKADVAVLSDPTDNLLKYQWRLENGETKYILDSNLQKVKTGFGKEIDFMENLVKQGKYKFDETECIYRYIGN